ncbi:MAG: DUF2779 domain-containing protein [Candidatus Taylorbacteria bacterium]
MKQLTKTDFILYKECDKNVWIKWHKPEEYNKFEISEFEQSLAIVGNEVEELARTMSIFRGGYLIDKRSHGAQELTKKLIAEHTPVIFQAVFGTDKYLAATDALVWNAAANAYDLYEIKMSSALGDDVADSIGDTEDVSGKPEKVDKKKELQYEYDLAFQVNVAKHCGVTFNKKYLLRPDKNYIRVGKIDPDKLFALTDKTEKVSDDFQSITLSEMEGAYVYLSEEKMPVGNCKCYYKGRSAHCTSFSISNLDVPKYSVHDLNRIGSSKKYLKELLDDKILKIDEVPEDERIIPKEAKEGEKPKKPRKLNQVIAYKTKKPIIDLEAIKKELDHLSFPLYFLDYETYPSAIPLFDGYHPYQNIVFQYSLNILRSKDAKLEHEECLILDGDPAERLVESLRKHIGDTGKIISWSKKFENSRNLELAHLVPSGANFLKDVVRRTYDLMDIVENQYYIHHDFKGSSSIKKVQPVLAPKYSYKELAVGNGTAAIEAYRQIFKGELIGAAVEEKKQQMLKYCQYDTEVMYEIWKFFTDLVK